MGYSSSNDNILYITRAFIMFGGVIPYIPQYYQIHKTKDASGFSTYICLVLVTASILRLSYWFGHWFEFTLVAQAVIMVIAMFIMLELCLRVERNRAEDEGKQIEESYFMDFNLSKFWQWTYLTSYLLATFLLLALSSSYTIYFKKYDYMIEPVGFIALLIEATLGLPQLIKNYRNKSTEGMSVWMVILWAIGDALKGLFFFYTNQPTPFKMCAVIQVTVDLLILFQVMTYMKPRQD